MLEVVGFLVLSNLYKYINSNIFQHNIFSSLSSNFFIALSPESKGLTIAPSCAITIVSSVFQIFYRIVPKVKRINDCPIMRDYNCIIEYFQNCIFLFFFFFLGWRQNLRDRTSRLSSSTVRSYRRMLSWLYIYILYIYVYTKYRPVSLALARKDLASSAPVPAPPS